MRPQACWPRRSSHSHMKNLKKTRRIQMIVIAAVALGLSTALIGVAFKDGINLFMSPSQILAEPPRADQQIRVGGLVLEGSLNRGTGTEVSFTVTDGEAEIPVTFTGVLPDLFSEGQGMMGTGRYADGTFVATEILAKHDETYMPKEVIDALKETGNYVEPET